MVKIKIKKKKNTQKKKQFFCAWSEICTMTFTFLKAFLGELDDLNKSVYLSCRPLSPNTIGTPDLGKTKLLCNKIGKVGH